MLQLCLCVVQRGKGITQGRLQPGDPLCDCGWSQWLTPVLVAPPRGLTALPLAAALPCRSQGFGGGAAMAACRTK
jgi:hypothetical protein